MSLNTELEALLPQADCQIAKPVTKHAEEQKVCHDKKEPEELKKVGHSA